MRITFICGSLNPGQDGVGDYTRRLAAQLVLDGHDCQLIAINDVVDSEETTDRTQIIRFKQLLSSPEKSQQAQQLIAQWNPDWISLQFVCFSFHPKGFIHRLTPFIQHCRGTAKLNIMFHELWVGEQPSLPFKHKVMGLIQRQQILKALKCWKPHVLHTSNRLYQFVLECHGYHAHILPIFGNIPVTDQQASADTSRRSDERTVLFPFSQRHDWNVVETMERLAALAQESDVSLKIVQIGHLRSGQQHWSYIQDFAHKQHWTCELLGERDEQTVSQAMLSADIGISSAHIHLANKSGAAVAMREHGLPVICTIKEPVSKRFAEAPPKITDLYSLFDSDQELLPLFSASHQNAPKSTLPKIARSWSTTLRNASVGETINL